MKFASMAVLLAAATFVLAGCGQDARVSRPPASRLPPVTGTKIPGFLLSAVPAGYRPALSARTVLDRFRRAHLRASNARGKPDIHLWMVNDAYPAWVITSGSGGNRSISIYDLRGRRWTMSFRAPLHFGA